MAERSVSVKLKLEEKDYLAGLQTAAAESKAFEHELEGMSSAHGKAVLAAGQHSTALRRMDADIAKAKTSVHDLGIEFAKTGDVDVFKKMRDASSTLATMEKMRTEVTKALGAGVEKDLAQGVEKGIEQGGKRGFGSLEQMGRDAMTSMEDVISGGIWPMVTAAALAAAPFIGATLGAAVLGAVGSGGIVGGIALAAQDAGVSSAMADLTAHIGDRLAIAAQPFIAATEDALHVLGQAFDTMAPSLDRIFSQLAPLVPELARGLSGILTEAMPGIEQAVQASIPLLRELAANGPAMGRAIASFLEDLARVGPQAQEAFGMLLSGIEGTIIALGKLIAFLTRAFDLWLTFQALTIPGMARMTNALQAPHSTEGVTGAALGIAEGFRSTAKAASDAAKAENAAADALNVWRTAVDRATGKALDLRTAQENWVDTIKAATDAIKENGRTLDINTPKGAANNRVLDEMARNGQALAQATYQQVYATQGAGAAQAAANQVYAAARQKLIDTAMAMGASATQARNLADQIMGIPPEWVAKITVNGIEYALSEVQVLRSTLDKLDGRVVTSEVRIIKSTGEKQYYASGNTAMARGGINFAADGLITNSPTVVMGEGRGWEAYIPQAISEYAAARLLQPVARWHPEAFAAVAGGMGGGRWHPADMRTFARLVGGEMAALLLRGMAGYNAGQARQAAMMARAG